ncbi:MAG: NADH-quinone oxidoreductase subunit J, partial [Desulfuromonadales bacterium]|nr:NADH-quinone oxidoreductase subunit J [Desulfuromonadales bacterium]NIS41789.1 NADH-quinone oxidoreductase subunit J [Desulfuromonadales bacterium]
MATVLFYILSAVALLATLGCVTRRNPVHAVIFLVHAFFALAMIFYILGAPLVAAWEVIIYAGA